MTSLPVLAVTGLAKEARLAAGPGVVAIGAGGDPQRLRRLLDARDPAGCRAVVSIGIAGGLDPSLQPGDVVVASGVLVDGRRYPVDAHIAEAMRRRLSELGAGPKPALRVIAADLAGVEAAVLTVDGKAALHAWTGAAAVDMESHVGAEFAARHALPFAAIRVVCDSAGRALPGFVAHALKPNGEPDIVAVLGALARRHVTVAELLHLAGDSSTAFKALALCRSCLGDGLGVSR